MQPEISRRCNSCGASIREAAMFCPECGKAVSQPREEPGLQRVAEKSSLVDRVVGEEATRSPQVATGSDAERRDAKNESPSVVSSANHPAKKSDSASPPVSKSGTIEKARDSLHRASTATREALADNVKRVERIRQVSSTVIEEAAYDPSLRFVLVALALFVVFIILLVLSKVMG